MEDSASDTSGFLREVSRDIAKTVTLALVGGIGILVGLTNEPTLHEPYRWPVILASVATIVLLLSFGSMLRLVARRHARLKVGRASGTRISILLPRLAGDDGRGTKRETIREDIKQELGDAIELVLWPEALTLSEGRDDDAERGSEETARKWLRQTGCDVIVWGSVRGDRVLSLRLGSAAQRAFVLDETLSLSKDFAGQLSIAVIGQALSEANIASQQGRASIPQLQQVGRRIEALLRRIESPEVTLGYAGVLARIGEQIGDRSLSERAIDMSVELLKSKAEFLDEETIYRVNSNIASMLLTLAYNNRDRSFLDRAMSYLTLARDMRAGKRPDINYGILMSMLGERELRHDYIELSINEFSEILSDNSGHFAEETIGKAWHNLGMANTVLYKITSNRDALDAGIAAFELALEFRRENDDPLYWAKTHDALGGTFFARGTALNNSEDVRCALPHFEAARDVYRRESMDHRVAEITYNFGCALACAAALDGSENDLLSAIAELRESEEFWKPERNGKWASAQNALGSAHINLAIMFSDAGAAEIGAECFQNAQLNLDPVSDLEAWVGVRNNEGRCLTVSGVLRGELQPLIEARTRLEECAQAIEPFPKHPLVRMVRHNLSDCYVKLSVLDGDHEYLELAIALHREAAAANGPGDDFELWSQELAEMVSLLLILAEVTNRAEPLQKARASLTKLIKECGERYEAEAYPAVCAVAETLLEQVGFAQQRLEA